MAFPTWYRDPITPRQRGAIDRIRETLSVPFHGRFKGEARDYIGKHYDLTNALRDQGITRASNHTLADMLLVKEEEL